MWRYRGTVQGNLHFTYPLEGVGGKDLAFHTSPGWDRNALFQRVRHCFSTSTRWDPEARLHCSVSENACIPLQLSNCPWRFFQFGSFPPLFTPRPQSTSFFQCVTMAKCPKWFSWRKGLSKTRLSHPEPSIWKCYPWGKEKGLLQTLTLKHMSHFGTAVPRGVLKNE